MYYTVMAILNIVFLILLYRGLTTDLPEDFTEQDDKEVFKTVIVDLYGPMLGILFTDISMIFYSVMSN